MYMVVSSFYGTVVPFPRLADSLGQAEARAKAQMGLTQKWERNDRLPGNLVRACQPQGMSVWKAVQGWQIEGCPEIRCDILEAINEPAT